MAAGAVSRTVRITQTNGAPDYCRRYNGATYDDYDAHVADLTGAGQAMWAGTSHIMYWGWDAKPGSMGLRLVSAPVVAGLKFEYSDGAAGWPDFDGDNPFHDNTSSLTVDGFMAWEAKPGANVWALETVDGQSAYWLRASITGHTTTGMFLNFLRNQTLQGPLQLIPDIPGNIFRDINDAVQDRDVAYTGPTKLTIRCELISTIHPTAGKGMPNLTLLLYWWQQRSDLYVEDLAQSTVPDLDCESYWKNYTGKLGRGPGEKAAPYKMGIGGYEINFLISASTAVMT